MPTDPPPVEELVKRRGRTILARVPQGLDALVLADLARAQAPRPLLHLARDDQRLAAVTEAIAFFADDIRILRFPAWDCLPYDRVGPAAEILATRIATLAALAGEAEHKQPTIIVSTVNAATQRVPPRQAIAGASLSAAPGNVIATERIVDFLQVNGFNRTGTVMDPGDFAVRGGIIDIFPPGRDEPVRLDFFGDALESVRTFDPTSQRTTGQLHQLNLHPANEVILNDQAVARFRTKYAAAFNGVDIDDPLYEAVTSSRRYQGMEHWLPLFYESLETIFDYVGEVAMTLDHQAEDAVTSRLEQIADYHQARKEALAHGNYGSTPYKPLPPDAVYFAKEDWTRERDRRPVLDFSPFDVPETPERPVYNVGGHAGRSFAPERALAGTNVYEAVLAHVAALQKARKRVSIAAWTEGAAERLEAIFRDHGAKSISRAATWAEASGRPANAISVIVLGLETGFETSDFAIIGEQDVLGDRLVRRSRKAKRAADFLSELASLSPGDLVVHVDHGIGRFEGLRTIEVQGAPHDCLFLQYAGGDRLFLPVENIELLSRYGSEDTGVELDKLGGGAWQARKARLKKRVREIAEDLIKTAAARELKQGEVITSGDGLYDEFSAGFPYEETDDQLAAIHATMADLGRGRPMDRLICGDVGFGKTEVALRSAFLAAMSGRQVAVVVPTTLLARQHFATFRARFQGFPIAIEQASRLVPRKDMQRVRQGLADGSVDIVVGTHALLAKDVKFRDLGLLVVDEEQHFGVKHKERLKELKANVHVLTLTATPIPRTLQLALSGIRELSLITTPPADRLAVRTYVSPFDPIVIRETLLREIYRGGQAFYVVPRISDLPEIGELLKTLVPDARVAVAHGRLPPTELEDIMSGFYDRKYDILLSTTIIESGLDIATANTLVVHRSDMFGLAQLYQLRGRVGRSKQRAYALFTVPENRTLTATADRRLKVLQSLDALGAGFTLASHDLDIRGAGNLLGEEQSGHIREVGAELYQQMLEEAVASLRQGGEMRETEETWSPQINIGTSVLIPESYVPDLGVRLGLYRRIADLTSQDDIEAFAAELHDRFGKTPEEVNHLLQVVSIKLLCRRANVESLDAGPKGAAIGFRNGSFPNPPTLVAWIQQQGSLAKLRPEMKLVVMRSWETAEERLRGARHLMGELVRLAGT
ncbi:MAG TPA: transcription-repair coupling factor [Aestuariivirgaceae bacterium]|nr:transcription-repair coupling factor [Aestuariivirgaceae bacterium]